MSSGSQTAESGGEVAWTEDAAGPVLQFRGSVDRDAVRRVRRLVPPASWPPRVDLSAATSLDAAGLELLVMLARKPRRAGNELEVLSVPAELRPALTRAGLGSLLPRTDGTTASA